jgi:ABC-type sugar transport system ATPase subunit
MTVSDNISFGLKLRGVGKAERQAAAKEAAALLGIESLLDRRPRALSGGQRQRVAMGRAIVRDPAVFLMDEPLSNLDAKLRTQMRVEIRKLQHRLGTTTIFVTHDQVEAMTLADRIAVLEGGYVQQFGAPAELYHRPINKFVAGFLVSPAINFITAKVVGENELHLPEGQKASLPTGRIPASEKLRQIDIGIRPEYIKISESRENATKSSITWQSTVTLVESLGSEVLVYVQLGSHEITVKVTDNFVVSEGSEVSLAFDLDQAHLFSSENGSLLSSGSKT